MKIYKSKVEKLFPQGTTLGEFLQKVSSLSLEKVSDAAMKGAVTLQRNSKGKILRSRDMRVKLSPHDIVQFTYDEKVLSLKVADGLASIYEGQHYSIWYKPAGMIAQGSASGDHTSLLRQVELKLKKETYLIHRLDRETMGMTVIGHTSEGARFLSELFAQNKVKKIYQAIVKGEIERGHAETISASLDGKEAITHIKSLGNKQHRSLLEVELETGKLHQIRRHLDFIGFPVMGDPKYGTGNKNRAGLQLLAQSISFIDPWDKTLKTFESPVKLEL